MFIKKIPYRSNFSYLQHLTPTESGALGHLPMVKSNDVSPGGCTEITFQVQEYPEEIHVLEAILPHGNSARIKTDLVFPEGESANRTKLELTEDGAIHLQGGEGRRILAGIPGMTFGICGASAIFNFSSPPDAQFYGIGEKCLGLEVSGVTTKFWNTDVWGEFGLSSIPEGRPDPFYVSVPYVIIKQGNQFTGVLIDNPRATFVQISQRHAVAGQMDAQEQPERMISLGCEGGTPRLIFIHGPSLPELTRTFQKLVGTFFLPPIWALGYHQCRWGYGSKADLQYVSSGMDRYGIPCDGLWLDIDYMDKYKVFTWNSGFWTDPKADLAALQKEGRRVIPIFDPGLKREPGYQPYESGKAADIFCHNPQGGEFVGVVWPGECAFPDFSLPETKEWWAAQVASFCEAGIEGAWIDMNDPSVGPNIDPSDMLFNRGSEDHPSYHNLYANGMAEATRRGLERANPGKRVFLITRSAFTGGQKNAGVFCGDNYSNRHHLRMGIPMTLNLALSGMPMNAGEVGGFGGNCDGPLMLDWVKACFLFPMMRNHTVWGSHDQEPWKFDYPIRETLRDFIRLRYSFRPYLYNLFVEHHRTGEAVLRPLFYDFEDTEALPLGRIDDQFLVGPSVMQAPFLDEVPRRNVLLPKGWWFAVAEAEWVEGGKEVVASNEGATTPIYLRDGSIIPMHHVVDGSHHWDGAKIEAHVILRSGKAEVTYRFDDGITLDFENGKQSEVRITVVIEAGDCKVVTETLSDGYGKADIRYVFYYPLTSLSINGRHSDVSQIIRPMAGRDLKLWATQSFSTQAQFPG